MADRFDWRQIVDEREKYAAYLASREWGEKRLAVLARSVGICERCYGAKADAVHHLNYLRKYDEHLEDLAAICDPCHQFTHGRSQVDPRATAAGAIVVGGDVVMFNVRSIYLAGTCAPWNVGPGDSPATENWRREITAAYFIGHKQSGDGLPVRDAIEVNGKRYAYTGPFIFYDHSSFQCDSHGNGGDINLGREETHRRCIENLKAADLVFAWIDRKDVYGTLVEIGMARALGKTVVVAGPERFDDLWFAYQTADVAGTSSKGARGYLESVLK